MPTVFCVCCYSSSSSTLWTHDKATCMAGDFDSTLQRRYKAVNKDVIKCLWNKYNLKEYRKNIYETTVWNDKCGTNNERNAIQVSDLIGTSSVPWTLPS
uniref:Secreted protein n=1 Tax=Steinernema glaseri TaxID=37863 RepID=A0A1I7Y730_9BILA